MPITEYICFNQKDNIFTQKGGPVKLVDKFTYFGSSVSRTENEINTRLAKVWTVIDNQSVIWKSDLTDKTKRRFFPNRGCVNAAIWMHHMNAK